MTDELPETLVHFCVPQWIQENKDSFLPPVCNKMMHNEGQLKVFFVGGPNVRKDYHIECGEELFFMRKGDMCLKVIEQGKHKDIPIKEGEIFLLPSRIAHSPQRKANTMGMVLEREREETELDGLRYHVEENGKPTLESLYEAWFHCTDLGTQLAPIIKGFFASEQYETGKPIPGTIPENPPVTLDFERKLVDPFPLKDWIRQNRQEIDAKGCKKIFEGDYQFQVFIYGAGESSDRIDNAETFIWQLEGSSSVIVNGVSRQLATDDTLLVQARQRFELKQEAEAVALVCYQDPSRKN